MISDLLHNICKGLEEHEIKYMISGSIALNIYSIPRMTRDIDIVLELSETGIDEFLEIFPDSYYNKDVIIYEIRHKGMFNIIDHVTGFKIVFIIRKESKYYNLAFNRRKRIHEFGTDLWVISLEDLIIAKMVWIQQYQSELQMMDIKNLLFKPDKDIDYIKKWCIELGLNTFHLFDNE